MYHPAAYEQVEKFIRERLLPGNSTRASSFRREILDAVFDPLADRILLHGPIGSGKSVTARAIGFGKRVAPLSREKVRELLQLNPPRFIAPGQIDTDLMPWYVEFSLTGVVESLAEAQLFGVGRKAASGVDVRPGIFERAQRGTNPSGRGEPDRASELTGGVVFLDEVGDMTQGLQAKLLPILSGGMCFRVGAEGDPNYEVKFKGTVISATWRDLDTLLRPDLLSRLSTCFIRVPGISERMEDFDEMLNVIQEELLGTYESKLDHFLGLPYTDREYWAAKKSEVRMVSPDARKALRHVSWADRGELRGLTHALRAILFQGSRAEEAIARLPVLKCRAARSDTRVAEFVADLLARARPTLSFRGGLLGQIEQERRAELKQYLLDDHQSVAALAKKLNLEEQDLRKQIRQIDRDRSRQREGDES